jgi:hypothetical protein
MRSTLKQVKRDVADLLMLDDVAGLADVRVVLARDIYDVAALQTLRVALLDVGQARFEQHRDASVFEMAEAVRELTVVVHDESMAQEAQRVAPEIVAALARGEDVGRYWKAELTPRLVAWTQQALAGEEAGWPLLTYACRHHNVTAVRTLLAHGAAPEPALRFYLRHNPHSDILKLLLDRLKLDASCSLEALAGGKNVLQLLCERANPCAYLLLDRGAVCKVEDHAAGDFLGFYAERNAVKERIWTWLAIARHRLVPLPRGLTQKIAHLVWDHRVHNLPVCIASLLLAPREDLAPKPAPDPVRVAEEIEAQMWQTEIRRNAQEAERRKRRKVDDDCSE